MPTESLLRHHATAARLTVDLATHATSDQLTLPSTCDGWTLRRLLDHMTSENRGFAAAARGDGADRSHWAGDPDRADPVGDYVTATEDLLAAFAEPGVLRRPFTLPLLDQDQPFPGAIAVTMQLVDALAHAWDLARTLDLPLAVDEEAAEAVLPLCAQIPDDESRRRPGATFAPRVPVADSAPAFDRMLGLLGRSPAWPN